MMLDNNKVAFFLGFKREQFNKLMSLGKIPCGIVKENKERNHYYILRPTLEQWLGRKLTEQEFEYLKKKEDKK